MVTMAAAATMRAMPLRLFFTPMLLCCHVERCCYATAAAVIHVTAVYDAMIIYR